MGNLPTRFWIAQGFGVDEEDKVNAYDNALYHMGLADQNMRYVSSVPPNTQIFDVLTRNGYSYIPVSESFYELGKDEFEYWRKLGHAAYNTEVPPSKDGGKIPNHTWYYLMGTSWCTDVVMTEMRGDAGEHLASALGIGRYVKHDGKIGVFAFENHGYVDSEDCADSTVEGILKMIEMRGHTPLERVKKPSSTYTNKGFKIGTLYRESDGQEITRYAKKQIYHHQTLDIDSYVTSMIVPEGHCGVVLTACVFDPFTEIRALSPSISF